MFKKLFLLFFSVFFVTSCNAAHSINFPAAESEPESDAVVMAKKGKEATIAFVTQSFRNPNDIYAYCTGVWINKDTILTAAHCAQGAATMELIKKLPPELRPFARFLVQEVKNPVGAEMFFIVEKEVTNLEDAPKAQHKGKVIAVDLSHDLALIKTTDKSITSRAKHSWLRVADFMPQVGSKVYVIGHPGGLYFTFFDGMVSAVREHDSVELDDETTFEGPFIQVFSGIYKGNSGGPVISEKGEIVGIVSFTMAAPNQGFAIASPSIKRFIIRAYMQNLL